jgi:hypothetical protein
MDTKHKDNRNVQLNERRQLRNWYWNRASQLIVGQVSANTHREREWDMKHHQGQSQTYK